MRIILIVLCFMLGGSEAVAEYINLPKDSNGWTVFTPSTSTKIIYVSTTGDDDTCTAYAYDDALIGSDPFNPSGAIIPCATYAVAVAKMRSGYPDWLLFKRGETFTATEINPRNGLSEDAPSLMGAYGSSGLSPIIKHGAGYGIRMSVTSLSGGGFIRFKAFSGITFYANTRDPTNTEEYTGVVGAPNVYITATSNVTNYINGILIEGCRFLYGDNNAIEIAGGVGQYVTVRRCVFLSAYPEASGHVQGLYMSRVDGVKFEENILDHNGWYDAAGGSIGPATIYNHNTYFAGTKNLSYSRNILSRGSNMGSKFTSPNGDSDNLLIDNNFYVSGIIGIDIGTNYVTIPLRFDNITISNNVMTNIGRDNSTGQGEAQHLQIAGWDDGVVKNNIFMNQLGNLEHSGHGISIWDSANLSIDGNVFHRLEDNTSPYLKWSGTNDTFTYTNNKINNPSGSQVIFEAGDLVGKTFSGNRYYDADGGASGFYYDSADHSFATWVTYSGDTSTYGPHTFTDSTRSVEKYLGTLSETQTIDRFIELIRAQDRYSWDADIMADPLNDYIRAGFDVTEAPFVPFDGSGNAAMNGSGSIPLSGSGSMTLTTD